MSRRVVITGLGTVNPLGNNVHDFWEGVKENRLGISKVEQFDTDAIGVSVAGQVKDFEPTDFIDKKEAKKMAADNLEQPMLNSACCVVVGALPAKGRFFN